MSILKLLGFRESAPPDATQSETETVRKIVRELDELEPERAKYLAAFAYMLSRVARADLHISDEESRSMERIVAEYGELAEQQAVLVVQIAKSQNLLFGGTENYLVSREFKNIASRDDKLHLLRCLFEVSASDESISTAESNVIRQIADELSLEHQDYIGVRSAFREHLAVLKKGEADA
jgi:uncharacterized tellurite resistance protein B-like protein